MKQSGCRSNSVHAFQVVTVNNDRRTEEEVLAPISVGYTGTPEILALVPRS